jgi:hypothetical protein
MLSVAVGGPLSLKYSQRALEGTMLSVAVDGPLSLKYSRLALDTELTANELLEAGSLDDLANVVVPLPNHSNKNPLKLCLFDLLFPYVKDIKKEVLNVWSGLTDFCKLNKHMTGCAGKQTILSSVVNSFPFVHYVNKKVTFQHKHSSFVSRIWLHVEPPVGKSSLISVDATRLKEFDFQL